MLSGAVCEGLGPGGHLRTPQGCRQPWGRRQVVLVFLLVLVILLGLPCCLLLSLLWALLSGADDQAGSSEPSVGRIMGGELQLRVNRPIFPVILDECYL